MELRSYEVLSRGIIAKISRLPRGAAGSVPRHANLEEHLDPDVQEPAAG